MKSYLTYNEKLCHPRNLRKLEVWLSENYTEKTGRTGSAGKGTQFLDLLRGSARKEYAFVPSPEFKPGRTFVWPPALDTRDYRNERAGRCIPYYTYVKPTNQLCKGQATRRIFCEMLGREVCLDCNGAEVRGRFSEKMNVLFPYLEYHKTKRPYGYCPRALRLTEPLPSRTQLRGFPIARRHGSKEAEWVRMHSDLVPRSQAGQTERILGKRRSRTCWKTKRKPKQKNNKKQTNKQEQENLKCLFLCYFATLAERGDTKYKCHYFHFRGLVAGKIRTELKVCIRHFRRTIVCPVRSGFCVR